MSVRPYPLCPRQPTLFTAHKLPQQFPKQPKFKMSSLKQVIYNALFKCATPEHGVVPSEFETAEAARDHFIALVMTELFPTEESAVVEVPVATTPQTLPERVAERKATKEEKAAAKAAKLAEKEAAKAAKEAEKAAAAKAKEEAKAAKEAEKAAKAEAKAAKAASPKKSPEEKAAEKEAAKAAKLAEKEAEKAAKLAEKEAEKAQKAAEKEAAKAAKEAAKKSPEQKAAEKEAAKAAKEAEKLAAKEAKEAEKAAAKAAKEAEKEAAKAAKEAEKEAAKAAKLAEKEAKKSPAKAAAEVALPASPKPKKAKAEKPAADANLPKVDPTWRKLLKEADKDRAKELEPELLTYLNAMSKGDFNGKTARDHVAAFMAARTRPTSEAVTQVEETDLDIVEFNGQDYYVNRETKRVYEGVVDEEGNLTVTKPVGYVGMADFKDMTLEDE